MFFGRCCPEAIEPGNKAESATARKQAIELARRMFGSNAPPQGATVFTLACQADGASGAFMGMPLQVAGFFMAGFSGKTKPTMLAATTTLPVFVSGPPRTSHLRMFLPFVG